MKLVPLAAGFFLIAYGFAILEYIKNINHYVFGLQIVLLDAVLVAILGIFSVIYGVGAPKNTS